MRIRRFALGDVYRVTVIDSACVSVTGVPWLSRTCAVKLYVPIVVALPLMTPVVAFSVRPAGRAPDTTDHMYGARPPVAASVRE